MNIGFWFDYDQTFTFTAVFKELQRRNPGLKASGFVINDRYWSHAVENLPPGTGLVGFYDMLQEGLHYQATPEERARFKVLDERLNLARAAYSDRHLAKFNHAQLINLFVFLVGRFEAYLDREKPSVFVFNCIASQYAHLFWFLLRERSIQVLVPSPYGVENLIYLADNPYFFADDVWETYRRHTASETQPPPDSAAFATRFIARVRQSQPAYSNAAVNLEQRKFSIPGPTVAARYLLNHVRYYRNDPTLPGVGEKLAKVVSLRHNRRQTIRWFQPHAAIEGHDFIYFPLHFEPEISTLVISQQDQASIIDIVARQLPLTWKLVVKEHPAMVGQRDHHYFARIARRYPNVTLLDPGVASLQLTREARCVLTLNGTVTLEALVLGTPVIYTSPSRFGGFGLGTLSQDLLNFNTVLQRAMAATHDDRQLGLMLAAIHQHCHTFEFAEPLGRPSVLSDSNIRAIADAIQGQIRAA